MPFPMEKPSEMAAITSISMPMISAVLMGFPPFGAGPAPLAVSAYHNWMKNARAAKLLDKRRPPDYNKTRGAVLLVVQEGGQSFQRCLKLPLLAGSGGGYFFS